jgi:hypothetical protein
MFHLTNHKRRSILAGLAASVSVGALPRLGGAQQSRELNLDGPLAAMKYYARIRCSEDGRPSAWYSQSTYYGQLDQEAPVAILGSEGLNLVNVEFDGKNRLIETTERVSYYTDLDTGEKLSRWRNVFTGEIIPLQKPRIATHTVIEDNIMSAEERSNYVDIDRTGRLRRPFLQGDTLTVPQEHFATFTASALGDTSGRRTDQRWWSGIWASFSAPVADLVEPGSSFVAGHGLLFGSAPWYSWLRMGELKGTSSVRRYLTKLPKANALPSRLLAWVGENHPDLLVKLGQ